MFSLKTAPCLVSFSDLGHGGKTPTHGPKLDAQDKLCLNTKLDAAAVFLSQETTRQAKNDDRAGENWATGQQFCRGSNLPEEIVSDNCGCLPHKEGKGDC